MKVEVNDRFRFASVWLTNEEKNNQQIRVSLQSLMAEYKSKKYKFVVFESGDRDLLEQTKGLLSHNKNLRANKG